MSNAKILPPHLDTTSATGLHLDEAVAQYQIGTHQNFVYLLIDWQSRRAALFDPHEGLGPIFAVLDEHKIQLRCVFLTHTHWDHVNGLPELFERSTDATVYLHEADFGRISPRLPAHVRISLIKDHESIALGSLAFRVMHTPGHSPGECCYFVEAPDAVGGKMRPYLFTGDTVFIRDCGRTDLAGGNTSEMFESLQKIRKLPPTTVILPGHHYKPECASTLETELAESPPFGCKSVAELEALP